MIRRIRQQSEAISAIDMESYGFYYAAKFTIAARPEVLCVKSAADYADQKKGDAWHKVCCFLSATLAREILLYHWGFEQP